MHSSCPRQSLVLTRASQLHCSIGMHQSTGPASATLSGQTGTQTPTRARAHARTRPPARAPVSQMIWLPTQRTSHRHCSISWQTVLALWPIGLLERAAVLPNKQSPHYCNCQKTRTTRVARAVLVAHPLGMCAHVCMRVHTLSMHGQVDCCGIWRGLPRPVRGGFVRRWLRM